MRFRPARAHATGFSLLEIMIALALGLLLSAGILSLFGSTSSTNKLQDGLARLQENGRFAVMRMERDLRQLGAQYCSNTAGASSPGTVVPVIPARAPMVYVPDIGLPDFGTTAPYKSINAAGNPVTAAAGAPYALSPRWFLQGHACGTSSCTPAVPSGSGQIPDMGTADGMRVPGSDVLTIRYQRGTGWPVPVNACLGAGDPLSSGNTIDLAPQTGDDPLTNMQAGDLALISDCVSPAIIPISAVTVGSPLSTVTVGSNILGGAPKSLCMGKSTTDVRLFDFTRDFVTVSYYLVFRLDDNPSARPNSGGVRLVPVLVRRENGVEQELVRGVDQLVFNYGVQDLSGNTRFMTATQVNSAANCPPPPLGLVREPGCMWRSVRTVEARLLVNTVDEVMGLDNASRSYHFNGSNFTRQDSDALPSGIAAGSQIRREFIANASSRVHNL